jgi:DNA-binding NtrC family response regulator
MSPLATGCVTDRAAGRVPRCYASLAVGFDDRLSSAHAGAKARRLLLVDPSRSISLRLRDSISANVRVTISTTFQEARPRLLARPPHLLVTNVRLNAHNGLHLVYLAATENLPTRSIVYAEHHDPALAREAQAAGAFYERADTLKYCLDAYVRAVLPPRDRRDVARVSRRRVLRGGRRAADSVHLGLADVE